MRCSNCGTQNPVSANFCFSCGRSLHAGERPRSFVEWLQKGIPAEGERRQVTILACDTVGSSLLAERMDPEEFLDLMNQAFEAILAPVFRNGGYLARLEGDGFKAFFGAPEAHEDDPLRAVRAGLEIQAAARDVAQTFKQERGVPEFSVRVGIHTDAVVVGPVGIERAVEYTAMGIGIVLATRLESIAAPGTVLVSETTQRLIGPSAQVVSLGPTQVKGRSQPVRVFRVVALRTEAEREEILGVRSPLVGRKVETAMLRAAFAKPLAMCAAGVPEEPPGGFQDVGVVSRPEGPLGGTIFIMGEAGVGKSRLLAQVRDEMTGTYPQLVWLEGRAVAQGQGAYGVLADLLRSHLAIGADDRMVDMRAKLQRWLAHLFRPEEPGPSGTRTRNEVATLLPHLANLLSLHLSAEEARWVNDLEPEAQERQIFLALRRSCERLTGAGPLVLAFEDLQGADEGAVRLLRDLMALIEERPILLIFVFRPEPGAACWQLQELARRAYSGRSTEIQLHSLSAEASNELIENLLQDSGGQHLVEPVRALIRERSGGNPLYIEEIMRSLIDRGVLEPAGARWQLAGEVLENHIPETLHGVILARLDRLEPEARRILQMAAVIGRTFSLRVLQAITGDGRDVRQHLTHLQRAELIYEQRRGTEQAFVFAHSLTQQVAYETLLRRQRRDYHRRVAQSIETLYADRLEEQFERLAYHYATAEAWEPALDYHIRFAHQAQVRFANDKAAEHYQHAWEILRSGRAGDEGTACVLHEAQGHLEFLAGNYQEARSHFEAALDRAHAAAHQARLLRKLGNVCQSSGDYEQGILHLRNGLALAVSGGNVPELASLYAGLGQIYHRRGDFRKAVALGLESVTIFERIDDRHGMALASNLLGIAYWSMARLDTARDYHEKGLRIYSSVGDVYGLAAAYNNLGRVLADLGELEPALHNFRQSKQLCKEIGYQHGLATALSHMSEIFQRQGHTEDAWLCQEQAFEIYNHIGFDGLDVQPEVLKMQVW